MLSAEDQRARDLEVINFTRHPQIGLRTQLGAYRRAALRPASAQPQFVIVAQGRSGSTLLGDLLANHPRVVFEDEILAKPVRLPHMWVKGLRSEHPDLVYGFHVKPYQLTIQQGVRDVRGWLKHLVDRGWTIIYLERRNLLRQALSSAVASVSGVYHRRGDKSDQRGTDLMIEPLLAGMRLRVHNLEEDRRALADLPHEAVDYERDLLDGSGHQATTDRLFAALGLDSVQVATELRRTSSHPAKDVGNWPEVRDAVLATPMADLIREVEPELLD